MKSTHIIILTVTTEKPVLGIEELIADRAWRLDGVCHTEARIVKTVPLGNQMDSDTTVTVTIDEDGKGECVLGDLPASALPTTA